MRSAELFERPFEASGPHGAVAPTLAGDGRGQLDVATFAFCDLYVLSRAASALSLSAMYAAVACARGDEQGVLWSCARTRSSRSLYELCGD